MLRVITCNVYITTGNPKKDKYPQGHSKTKGAASDMAKSYLLFDHCGGLLTIIAALKKISNIYMFHAPQIIRWMRYVQSKVCSTSPVQLFMLHHKVFK